MYGNYRNYYMDYANRQAAQNNFMDGMEAGRRAQQASAEYDRNAMAAPGFMGSRSPSGMGHMTQNHAGRYYQQLENQYAHHGNTAMQNALNNEATQVQDRMANYHENIVAGKRHSDIMRYELERQKANQAYDLGMAQNRSLDNLAQNMDFNMNMGDTGMPETNLYDNDGERIGGSSPKNSLFAQSGIKKSLLS
jgi:hypothetical protein